MTLNEARKIVREGGTFPDLFDAVGTIAMDGTDPLLDNWYLWLALTEPGIVGEQAMFALYRRTGRSIPKNRDELVQDPHQWGQWLAECGIETSEAGEQCEDGVHRNTLSDSWGGSRTGVVIGGIIGSVVAGSVGASVGAMVGRFLHGGFGALPFSPELFDPRNEIGLDGIRTIVRKSLEKAEFPSTIATENAIS